MFKADSIKLKKPLIGSKPHVPVFRLLNVVNGVDIKVVEFIEAVMIVLLAVSANGRKEAENEYVDQLFQIDDTICKNSSRLSFEIGSTASFSKTI